MILNKILLIKNLYGGYYKDNFVLKGLNMEIIQGETVAVTGHNGSGKSTLAKSIMRLLPYTEGDILFKGKSIIKEYTYNIAKNGISYFPQGGQVFPHLSVDENLFFAGRNLRKEDYFKRRDEVISYFNVLQNLTHLQWRLQASYLSGGERNQLALAMNLMLNPSLLILDEPSAGLAPSVVKELYNAVRILKAKENISILLIEQNIEASKENSENCIFIKDGIIYKEFTKTIDNNNL